MSDDRDFPDGPRPLPLRERDPAQLTDEQRDLLEAEEAADRATIGCAILLLVVVAVLAATLLLGAGGGRA